MSEPIRLTQYSHGAGCGCKISPKVLEVILAGSGAQNLDPKLWVGNASRDDAAVYALDDSHGGDGILVPELSSLLKVFCNKFICCSVLFLISSNR